MASFRQGLRSGMESALIAAGTGLGMALIPRCGERWVPYLPRRAHGFRPAHGGRDRPDAPSAERFGRVSAETGGFRHGAVQHLSIPAGRGPEPESPRVREAIGRGEDPADHRRVGAGRGEDRSVSRSRAGYVRGLLWRRPAISRFSARPRAGSGSAEGSRPRSCAPLGTPLPPDLHRQGPVVPFLEKVPVRVVLNDRAALLGAARHAASLLIFDPRMLARHFGEARVRLACRESPFRRKSRENPRFWWVFAWHHGCKVGKQTTRWSPISDHLGSVLEGGGSGVDTAPPFLWGGLPRSALGDRADDVSKSPRFSSRMVKIWPGSISSYRNDAIPEGHHTQENSLWERAGSPRSGGLHGASVGRGNREASRAMMLPCQVQNRLDADFADNVRLADWTIWSARNASRLGSESPRAAGSVAYVLELVRTLSRSRVIGRTVRPSLVVFLRIVDDPRCSRRGGEIRIRAKSARATGSRQTIWRPV